MFRLRPRAAADIERIAAHISAEAPFAAERWLDGLMIACRRLGDMPGIGLARDDIRPGLRRQVFGNYLILYREVPGGVEIVRVIHGARRWEKLLRGK